jgi:hypothetical protein
LACSSRIHRLEDFPTARKNEDLLTLLHHQSSSETGFLNVPTEVVSTPFCKPPEVVSKTAFFGRIYVLSTLPNFGIRRYYSELGLPYSPLPFNHRERLSSDTHPV